MCDPAAAAAAAERRLLTADAERGFFFFCLRKKKSAQPNTQEWRLVQIWPPSVLTVVAAARLVVARRCSSAIKSQ